MKVIVTMVFSLALLCGCVSLMEKTGRVLDGSAFKEKKIARYRAKEKEGAEFDMELRHVRNKAGQQALLVSQNKFPAIQLRTSEPDMQGKFFINSLDYVSGNTAGWNQYSLELSGTGDCFFEPSGAVFSLDGDIEKIQVSGGKIRLYDTTITGGDALNNLRNREERINVLTDWMKSLNTPELLDRRSFTAYWKPILFPEICAKRKRPADWQLSGDEYNWAEEIKWNKAYSIRIFPEILRPVRDSGTLLRDWEEAFEWIYLQYEWETLIGLFSREITLKRVK